MNDCIDFNMTGKIAIVTGSTKGIGLAIAEMLARSGVQVFVNSRTGESVNMVVEKFNKDGLLVSGLVGDASDETFVKKSVEKVISECGHIDILVNNVGMYSIGEIEKISTEQWDEMFKVNLKSCFLWTKEIVPYMKEQRFGKIINIASISGIDGRPNSVHYNATKGGMISMTKGLAKDLGPFNINVNAVAPGFILSDLMQGEFLSKVAKFNRERTPLPRQGVPRDVAGVAFFLASPLSDFITGEVIIVDGGFSVS